MRSTIRVGITLAMVVAAIFAGSWIWQHYMYSPWTRDARVRADVVTIAPDVSGWVVELKVRDNQQVKAGDLLMSIDRDRYQAAVEKARAVVDIRRQQLSLREHEASRRSRLGAQAISAELLENAQINAEMARSEYREAQADLRVAELNLARSEVHAPRDGQITNLVLAQGNYVNAGQSVMALVDTQSFYVQAYFEETKLPRIQVGASVEVWLMGGDQQLRGQVESISRGITDRNASPDGQLLADVEPTLNWVRLAQRIPVRIRLDEVPDGMVLSAGMTASVRVE
ncbi:efflux RND transporter periplasmic adaptor subunit [Ectopseudomonas toyotomiensis]|uniref:RND family efflux transporter, MFP subunit n=1 Tax=Ectopseudomonas toyotomiensis TaxID=554344 RepID=A0A1I5MAP2_9GAMM|nr:MULTISPECIES: efflux RND transporter periplasmic adaptor subunit [Pseudomonas]PIA74678.1 efflux RND transporter periplasmic adaptor subunit [Pseudomonas toyotomiensis]SDA56452.1 RND family efflux transporter, MFP subunit [Pseudomonas sp. NFPP33]SFP06417.1 RND family efflux transporter, MFP subunit [Pseudomonas toyotomiensis]